MATDRLERIETDLETVKELLVSTASYAESAQGRLDRLSQRLEDYAAETQRADRQFSQRLEDYAAETHRADRQLSQRIDGLTTQVQHLSQQQIDLTTQVQQLTQQQTQTADRLDEYIHQSQLLLTQTAERSIQNAGRVDRLEGVMAMLSRLQDRQQAQLENQQVQIANQQEQIGRMDREFAEHQRTTNAALERIDRLLDYLVRRDQETGGE